MEVLNWSFDLIPSTKLLCDTGNCHLSQTFVPTCNSIISYTQTDKRFTTVPSKIMGKMAKFFCYRGEWRRQHSKVQKLHKLLLSEDRRKRTSCKLYPANSPDGSFLLSVTCDAALQSQCVVNIDLRQAQVYQNHERTMTEVSHLLLYSI